MWIARLDVLKLTCKVLSYTTYFGLFFHKKGTQSAQDAILFIGGAPRDPVPRDHRPRAAAPRPRRLPGRVCRGPDAHAEAQTTSSRGQQQDAGPAEKHQEQHGRHQQGLPSLQITRVLQGSERKTGRCGVWRCSV